MAACIFCQHELDEASNMCPQCGRAQPPGTADARLALPAETRPCPTCAAVLPAAARFCGHCGQPLEPLAPAAAPGADLSDAETTLVLKKPLPLPADAPSLAEQAAAEHPAPNLVKEEPGPQSVGYSGVARGLRFRVMRRAGARAVLHAPPVPSPSMGVPRASGVRRLSGALASALVLLLVVGGLTTLGLQGSGPLASLFGGRPTSGTVVVATTTPTPTPTSTPASFLELAPAPPNFVQTCTGSQPLAPLAITLANPRSMPANWQMSITDIDPAGHVWATASPTSGTLSAGQSVQVMVTPIPTLCQELQQGGPPVVFTAVLKYATSVTGQPTIQFTITDMVTPPA